MAIPIALTVAGSDSGGGAGLQADLKTFAALRVHGATAVTAVTAQNTVEVTGVHPVPPEMVAQQIATVFDDIAVAAVKTGMLVSAETVAAVAGALGARGVPLVVDPVLVSRTGTRITDDAMLAALKERLIPLATVLTPNLDEAAVLTGTPVAKTLGELIEQGHALQALGPDFVVLKGGRGRGEQATDIVLQRGKDPSRMGSPRVATRNNHGTGCTHSAAITAHIAHDLPASDAIGLAKLYVAGAIEAADYLNVGLGHGPVHHFHRQWLDARKGETH